MQFLPRQVFGFAENLRTLRDKPRGNGIPVGSTKKKRPCGLFFLVLPTGIEPITNP